MAQKTFTTRLKLKYDTLANWNKIAATFVPLKGEVCFVEVPNDTDSIHNAPSILFKVGDGVNNFGDLKWGSGLAADVYSWAKTASKPSYTASEVGVTEANFPGLNAKGTVTAIKINGETKNPDTSGLVELGKYVQTIEEGTANGTIAVDGTDVKVHGLGSAAYTASTVYATREQGDKADAALPTTTFNSYKETNDAAVTKNATDISNLQTTLKSGVTFKGKVNALPATTDYANGDLIIVGTKEYICLEDSETKSWVELGDEGTHLTKTTADGYYVPLGRTIAGVDLNKDITKSSLLSALGVADGATKVTESTVSGWGFTKNNGTLTGITMNGSAVTANDGVVDLGTVITDISSKQDTLKVGSNISITENTISATWPTTADSGYEGVGKTGTVTSVAAEGDSFISVSGSPITSSGTLSFSLSTTKLVTTDDTVILDCGSSTVNI